MSEKKQEVVEETKVQRRRNFLDRFKLGPHHVMERFGVMILILLVATAAITASIGHTIHLQNQEILGNQAIYTKNFTLSLSKNTGVVEGAYRNADKTEFFLLLKLDNLNKMSTDAKDYRMYLTGANMAGRREALKSLAPAGVLYMFGSTGYMGIHITSTEPFPEQIMHLVVRNNYMMVPKAKETITDRNIDDTFFDNDQFLLLFNPAGDLATVVDFLDKDDVGGFDMFYEMQSRDKELKYKALLNDQLNKMFFKELEIREFERRLQVENQIQVPERPELIGNDKISAFLGDKELSPHKTQAHAWVDENNQIIAPELITFRYEPGATINGGFNLDWQDETLRTSYIDKVYSGARPWRYIEQNKELDIGNLGLKDLLWYASDGEKITLSSGTSLSSSEKQRNANIESLQTAWRDYFSMKSNYQRDLMYNLLYLEVETRDASDYWTINREANVLITY